MPRFRGYPHNLRSFLFYGLCAIPLSLSRSKTCLLRSLGADVGRGVRFGARTRILCKNYAATKIGDYVQLYPDVFITCDHIEMGEDARIDSDVRIRGPGSLVLGKGCYVGARAYIDVNRDVTIDDDAGVGPGTWIFTHSVWQPVTGGGQRKFGPVHIEKGAWIPGGVFILPGVTVGHDAVVGARSLLNEDVAPLTFVAGSPAKLIRTLLPARMASDQELLELARQLAVDFGALASSVGLAKESAIDIKEGNVVQLLTDRRRRRGTYVVEWRATAAGGVGEWASKLADGHAERCAVVGLRALPASVSAQLSLAGVGWFDAVLHLRGGRNNQLDHELHNFLRGEYGIRTYRK